MWAGTLASVLILAGPAIANAEIARDPSDTPGPLDLVRVKVGQKDTQLQARISVSRPLPQLTQLRDHPNFESQKPAALPLPQLRLPLDRASLPLPGREDQARSDRRRRLGRRQALDPR